MELKGIMAATGQMQMPPCLEAEQQQPEVRAKARGGPSEWTVYPAVTKAVFPERRSVPRGWTGGAASTDDIHRNSCTGGTP